MSLMHRLWHWRAAIPRPGGGGEWIPAGCQAVRDHSSRSSSSLGRPSAHRRRRSRATRAREGPSSCCGNPSVINVPPSSENRMDYIDRDRQLGVPSTSSAWTRGTNGRGRHHRQPPPTTGPQGRASAAEDQRLGTAIATAIPSGRREGRTLPIHRTLVRAQADPRPAGAVVVTEMRLNPRVRPRAN